MLVTYEYVKVKLYMWRTGMTDHCGTVCNLHRAHVQYGISFSHDFSKKKVFFNRNSRALALQARNSKLCVCKRKCFRLYQDLNLESPDP